MEKVKHYVRGLKPSSSKEMLEKLQSILADVDFDFLENRRIAAAKEHSPRTFMGHAQP